jgi:hypothetical protein
MPRFAVELEYLVPVCTTVVVEADDENHAKAAADDADCWDARGHAAVPPQA